MRRSEGRSVIDVLAQMSGLEGLLLVWIGIFTRISAVLFFLPGIGEQSVPTRVRLGAAIAMAVIVIPLVADTIAPPPQTPRALISTIGSEAIAGLAIGLTFRLMVYVMQTAGAIASQSLAVAQMFGGLNPGESEPILATFLSLSAIALAVAAGLHIQIVATIALSYDLIPYGFAPRGEDLGSFAADSGSFLFNMAIGLALPFIVVAFLYNMALGVINRAMPSLMVAFVGAPGISMMGIALLMLTLPVMLSVWIGHLDAAILDPFGAFR